MTQFFSDVIEGLSSTPKYLPSKYFYDETGDALFQQIMQLPEYYLTRCEEEIFNTQSAAIADALLRFGSQFDVVELGAGDASKTMILLKELAGRTNGIHYYPIDISANVISYLQQHVPAQLPGVGVYGLNGEYMHMLQQHTQHSSSPKLVLFLGANIGNITVQQANIFCTELRHQLATGDRLLIGFDLQKEPNVILDAYNDAAGITKAFNLNLLTRINKELGANFDVLQFRHHPIYERRTGACKSYLISQKEQVVEIADHSFIFSSGESIFMEISQKYTIKQIEELARQSGFQMLSSFYDDKRWFVDVIWECI